ncbi:MAG: CDP-diacylglycerol--glycerol-3-phosphate 3-phosphatidyltransferase [Treponema sp.]|jgi:CDP-diacylglycerol--glycerol-3-phosphate 3-phosphatidyltransferase|nr:CDP-diacylglycerol--glycerol-3-phosphate 3-phosphatidyltransferase [Treponema sp.]
MLLANKLSFTRIFFAPFFFIVYNTARRFGEYTEIILIALFILLIFVEFTDFLDGYFARKLNQVSNTGKLLDPFADAFLHISIFFCFAMAGIMPDFLFILIFYREFFMLFLRMLSIKKGVAVAARMGGKFKTVLYIGACFYTLLLEILSAAGITQPELPLKTILAAVFYLCAAASCLSFADYLIQFRRLSNAPPR